MILNLTQVLKCCPRTTDAKGLMKALNDILPQYGITTAKEVAAFVSQCGHESLDFTHLEENLNYSAAALQRVWPSRFPTEQSTVGIEHNPVRIANIVYSNRMGNGDEQSGDGWNYHGRGAIQLTGKNNYEAFAKYKGMENISVLQSYLVTLEGAVDSAAWFWTTHNLNSFADRGDIEGLTRRINGGTLGLDDRKARYDVCLGVLNKTKTTE